MLFLHIVGLWMWLVENNNLEICVRNVNAMNIIYSL